jgi:hypothetical protein
MTYHRICNKNNTTSVIYELLAWASPLIFTFLYEVRVVHVVKLQAFTLCCSVRLYCHFFNRRFVIYLCCLRMLVSNAISISDDVRVFNSHTTDFTCRAETVNPSRAHVLTPCFSGVCVAKVLVFRVVFCISFFFFLFLLFITTTVV